MDFESSQGGSGGADGCIDFRDPDNGGLKGCMLSTVHERDSSDVSLESMWQEFCTEVSVADFFVIAAEALMVATAASNQRGAWANAFSREFAFGRTTALTCNPRELPNPIHSCDATEEVFMERMGLTATQATALMGVHTLGRALAENSGYDGFWVSRDHAKTFNNQYYTNLIAVGWRTSTAPSGKKQWVRADVGPDHELGGEMMLNTDMCLAFQTGGRPGADIGPYTRAEDTNHTNCCLWMDANSPEMSDVECGCQGQSLATGCTHTNCCIRAMGACRGNNPFRDFTRGDAWSHARTTKAAVVKYAKTRDGTESWRADFMPTWKKVTEQGHDLCPHQ